MTIHFTNNNGDATITLCGRLDTSVSTEIKSEIDKNLATAENINSLTMDAEGLEYISSSGLRILLVLAKSYKNFKVVNVNPDVYDVLNMTGFSKIINVERALRQLSIDGCEQIGVGGVGTVYRLDGDTIIKVFREGTTIDEVRKEITMSKEAFVMGTPTAMPLNESTSMHANMLTFSANCIPLRCLLTVMCPMLSNTSDNRFCMSAAIFPKRASTCCFRFLMPYLQVTVCCISTYRLRTL